jgi:protein SCO1/2
VTLLLAVAAGGCGAPAGERFAAASVVPGAPRAPGFTLTDPDGRRVELADFRGRAVLLTFLYVHCPDVCPLTVERVRVGLARLGSGAVRAQLVVVSVDPGGDTPASVRAFVRAHRMRGRMTYLVGTHAQLAPVWKRYGVAVLGSPEDREIGHSALVVGIDAAGRRRVQFAHDFTAEQIAHDVPRLAAG